MSVYEYEYQMKLKLNAVCTEHAFSIMCYPNDNERQKVLEHNVIVSPNTDIKIVYDWAQNAKGVGTILDEHTEFSVLVKGKAETYNSFYEEYEENPSLFYKYPTELTYASEEIKELAKCVKGDTLYDKVINTMHMVHKSLKYEKGHTDSQTKAMDALKRGVGVCQDYAHLMLSILRENNIYARYVAGLVAGEGESHAWVEANLNGYWYAFDPTADRLVGDAYLKFSHGRDASDCAINRGSFKGYANQEQEINSIMKIEVQ